MRFEQLAAQIVMPTRPSRFNSAQTGVRSRVEDARIIEHWPNRVSAA